MIKSRTTLEKILDELRSNPTVTIACKKAGVSKPTIYRWAQDDPVFRQQFEEAKQKGREDINDIAESFIVSEVKRGSVWAIKYWKSHNDPRYSRKLHDVQIVDEHPSESTLEKVRNFFGVKKHD